MNPDQSPSQQINKKNKVHPMVVLQPGERIICEIKRHPFGIISVYAAALFAIIVAGVLAVSAPNLFSDYNSDSNLSAYVAIGVVLFIILMGLILVVATVVYWQNRWIVTDDSITQITQDSLFGRRVSQLSMENLEDITVDQHGILPNLFNYGTLKAETAGEHSKFTFLYCPEPNKYARLILEVHETFLHQRRHQPQAVHPITPINGPHFDAQAQAAQQQSQSQQQQPVQQYPQPSQPQQFNASVPQQQYAANPLPQQQGTWQPGYQQQTSDAQPQTAPQYPQSQPQPWQPPQDQQDTRSQDPQQPPQRPTTLPPPLQ